MISSSFREKSKSTLFFMTAHFNLVTKIRVAFVGNARQSKDHGAHIGERFYRSWSLFRSRRKYWIYGKLNFMVSHIVIVSVGIDDRIHSLRSRFGFGGSDFFRALSLWANPENEPSSKRVGRFFA
jgi:hypothetical protein